MKYYTFHRENNDFEDILKDNNIKKKFDIILRWKNHLQIGIDDNKENEKISSFIMLRYGDDLIDKMCEDYSPISGVDYQPKRN
jgi:hypothetical protein